MIGLGVHFSNLLFYRALILINHGVHVLNPYLFKIMPKRSFSEIDILLPSKKNKSTVPGQKLGYGGLKAVQKPMSSAESSTAVDFIDTIQQPVRSFRKSKRLEDISLARGISQDINKALLVSPAQRSYSSSSSVPKRSKSNNQNNNQEMASSSNQAEGPLATNNHAGNTTCNRPWSSLPASRLRTAWAFISDKHSLNPTEEPSPSTNATTDNASPPGSSSRKLSNLINLKVNSTNRLFKNLRRKQPTAPQKQLAKQNSSVRKTPVPSSSQDNALKYNFEYLENPVKSPKDAKHYKVIRLCNGLRAILVSDVRTERELEQCVDNSSDEEDDDSDSSSVTRSISEHGSESEIEEMEVDNNHEELERSGKQHYAHRPMEEKLAAVGLTIGVGSFSDPEDIPGLAHFLEHMVFMGSAKYPKENDFDSFIKRHGGSDNAHTAFETTTFYFECQDKHLLKGMDKFSQFFKNPLLKKEAMTREREAVESEFQESKSSDGDRIVQLLAGLAKPGHPATKFTWGNSVTLQDNVKDNNLHAALHAFRLRHYSGHRMTLAVEARLPMEVLESLVASSFSSIPNNALPADDLTPYVASFDTPEFNRVYRVSSIKDRMELMLTWPFPSFLKDYKNKPYEYLESLLDHEGKGSLLNYLREKQWALEISSGEAEAGFENNSMFFLFSVTVLLTEEGYKHVDEVITAVFSYISMLRREGPCERFFTELQSMSETNFLYADEIPPGDYVEQLCEAMQYYEPEDVLAATYLMYDFNAQSIKDFQDGLVPERVNVIITSKDPAITYDKEERWFKTKYSVADIPLHWMKVWKTVEGKNSFHIPEPNIYIPSDLSILKPDGDELLEEYPYIIEATRLCEVWYKRDTKFNLPIAYYMLYLISPLPSSSPFNSVLLDIYAAMLEYTLAADLYASRLGSISYVISPSENGIKIRVGGFNEKLPLVMETIAQHMAAFKDNFNEQMFYSLKEEQAKIYYNRFIKPEKLNSDLRLQLLLSRFWTCVNKHAAVSGATIQMLLDFVFDYHKSMYIQALVQGNVTRQQALQACHTILNVLDSREIPDFQYPEFRVTKVDAGDRLFRVSSFNREDSNSVITNYYQCGLGTIRTSCILELVLSLMEEPLFDTLRTKEQLGYSVDCVMKDTYGVIGYTVTVNYQEDKFSISHVEQRIQAFLENFTSDFSKMKAKKLDEARKTLIKLKLCSDVHLKEECNRNWGEILSTAYLFDRPRKEVECLNEITMKEVRIWVDQLLDLKSHYRKLSIQVVGNPAPKKAEPELKKKTSNRKSNPPVVDERLADVSIPTLVQQPGPKYSLDILTPDNNPGQAIKDIDKYRQSLSVYPLHRILQ